MWEIVLDTAIDALKMLPFLLGAYLLMEVLEHKASHKMKHALAESGKWGPVWGSFLGIFPQCGFSVAAANLYAGGMITTGTLIAVFISTSDEALPILLAHPESYGVMLQLLAVKVAIAILAGFLAEFLFRKNVRLHDHVTHPEAEKCNHGECHGGIWVNALRHTGSTFLFLAVCMLALNFLIDMIGQANLERILLTNHILQPAVAALVGFIPNCAGSVVLTELFLSGTIGFGSVVAGLCTGAGIGMLVLWKQNHKWQENLKICGFLYAVGTLAGMFLQLFQ